MMESQSNDKYKEIDALLRGLFHEVTLRELFDKRLHELKTNQTSIQKLLKIERRSINGVLDGTQRRADVKVYNKLASFLNISPEQVIQMHLAQVERNFVVASTPLNKKKFIRENFDATVLKKAGFIKDASNYIEIDNKIVSFFGFDQLFEYEKRSFNAFFSAGAITPSVRINTTRDFWLTAAKSLSAKLDNPYPYNRQKLIEYFPQIRWHSTNVGFGLVNVIKALYRLGITVLYQPPFSSLHLRGVTFPVNNKPTIVLTDHKGFYPTLWHCLIHELYHVLFDWEEIKNDGYLISEDSDESLTLEEREVDADDFARDYLFSAEKLEEIKPYMRDSGYISEVAKNNNVHPSFIYVYYAHDNAALDRKAWARARVQNPDVKKAVHRLENDWNNVLPIEEFAKKLKLEIYN